MRSRGGNERAWVSVKTVRPTHSCGSRPRTQHFANRRQGLRKETVVVPKYGHKPVADVPERELPMFGHSKTFSGINVFNPAVLFAKLFHHLLSRILAAVITYQYPQIITLLIDARL